MYIGETDNLRRRLASNYRSPGPTQQTSLRVNELLCEHLTAGGRVRLAVATAATVPVNGGVEHALDLRRKAGRLLAESAALVLAQVNADARHCEPRVSEAEWLPPLTCSRGGRRGHRT